MEPAPDYEESELKHLEDRGVRGRLPVQEIHDIGLASNDQSVGKLAMADVGVAEGEVYVVDLN